MNNGMNYPYMQTPFMMNPGTPGCVSNNEIKMLENRICKLEQRVKKLEEIVLQPSMNSQYSGNYDSSNYSMM